MTTHPTDNAPVHELLAGTTPEITPTLAPELVERVAREFSVDVAVSVFELPDRTSPDDWPEAMLVTASELSEIIEPMFVAAIAAMQPAAVDPMQAFLVSELRLLVETQRARLATQASEVARLRVINAGLVEALKPFARVHFDLYQSDDCYVTPAIQIGHLRDARQAIASATGYQRGPVLDAWGAK